MHFHDCILDDMYHDDPECPACKVILWLIFASLLCVTVGSFYTR